MISLRDATTDDVPVIHDFICQLAAYEKQPDAVKMTPDQLREALFGAKPRAEALVALVDAAPQGFAVWFESFNTWTGKPGMYLEDLFITPAARGLGLGRKIFSFLAQRALAQGCQRLEWQVLDWNEPAIGFYQKMGAEPLSDWTKYRLSGAALEALGAN